jgi:hypothetical protein
VRRYKAAHWLIKIKERIGPGSRALVTKAEPQRDDIEASGTGAWAKRAEPFP